MSARFVTYSVYISHSADGYTAVCPAFPNIVGTGRGACSAYARLKALIEAQLRANLANFQPLPKDPLIQTRKVRFDLWYLSKQESLG